MNTVIKTIYISIITLFLSFNLNAKITSSIFPLHMIVAMLTNEIDTEFNYILSPNNDMHHIELNYNQVKNIKSAEIIILISKKFEKEIYKAINQEKSTIIEIQNIPDINLYNVEKSQFLNNTKGLNQIDYHLWLDIDNIKIILSYLGNIFAEQDPNNKNQYLKNVKKYTKELTSLDKKIKKLLIKYDKNIMFYHGAWQYYLKRYNIKDFGYIAVEDHLHHHNHSLGTKKIIALKYYIEQNNINCIFTEQQNPNSKPLLEKTLKDFSLKIITLDPLSSSQESKDLTKAYSNMMLEIANKIKSC